MFEDVKAFHLKMAQLAPDRVSHLTRRKLADRANFMLEELKEFTEAAGLAMQVEDKRMAIGVAFIPDKDRDVDLAGQADALIDLAYVALGTAIMMGLPWTQLWDDVHAANMRKVPGPTKRNVHNDVTKPPNWVGPRGAEILAEHGYRLADWTGADGKVDERLCLDDAP